jgi:hypothetical protein
VDFTLFLIGPSEDERAAWFIDGPAALTAEPEAGQRWATRPVMDRSMAFNLRVDRSAPPTVAARDQEHLTRFRRAVPEIRCEEKTREPGGQ